MKHNIIISTAITLILASQHINAGSIADVYDDVPNKTLTVDMMNNIKTAVNDNDSSLITLGDGKVSITGDTMTGTLIAPALDVISSSDSVLQRIINTSTGSERLYFGHNTTSDAGIIVYDSLNTTDPGLWRFFNNKTSANYDWIIGGNVRMFLANNGNLGIGTTTPTLKLHVNGTAGGTSGYQVISDAKYKMNIVSLQDSLQKIMQLRGVSYDWRSDDYPEINFSEGSQVGFIAQELEQVVPEAVNQDINGDYSVAYSTLIPVLIEAIKEQQSQIDQLEAQLQLLTGQ